MSKYVNREEYEKSKLVYFEVKAVSDTAKEEGRMEGREEGRTEAQKEAIMGMYKIGLSKEQIALALNLSLENVEKVISAMV